MAVTITATLQEPNGRKFTKRATGDDQAAAADALADELAITVGIVSKETLTQELAGPFTAASGTYSDANFEFRDGARVFNVHFEQLTNAVAESVGGIYTGYVDIDNALVQAWAASSYPDATLISGKYVR